MLDSRQYRFIIDLPAGLARDAQAMVGSGERYDSMSSLVAVALANQMQLERSPAQGEGSDTSAANGWAEVYGSTHGDRWIAMPDSGPPALVPPLPAKGPLSSFTNRLAPLIAPLRVLAALQQGSSAPVPWARLVDQGALTARHVGLQIREEDEQAGRRGRRRRWTGWPVGADQAASLARFRSHFIGRADRDPEESPLLALGLVGVHEKGIGLTPEGWQFVSCPTPILGETSDEQPLASEQRLILARALSRMPAEWSRIEVALRALVENDGDPLSLEAAVASQEPTWTEPMVASFRSGIIGRMADAGLVTVEADNGRAFPVHGDFSTEALVRS